MNYIRQNFRRLQKFSSSSSFSSSSLIEPFFDYEEEDDDEDDLVAAPPRWMHSWAMDSLSSLTSAAARCENVAFTDAPTAASANDVGPIDP